MKNIILFIGLVNVAVGQTYHPAAGQPGTSAMHQDSSAFIAWATGCSVKRGPQDISNPSLGNASVGDSSMALGKSQSNGVVSLGDGGMATCRFLKPIKNGTGPDFAVFENSIDDSFLELAFVEVSSDGIQFFRFPSHSLTDTTTQTNGFGSTDPKRINNLAGKYRAGFGTPFDLQELAGNTGLNVDAITHVRIVDVVGCIQNAYTTRDSHGNKINDPWPNPFPSGGFDLDAIGVVHQSDVSALNELSLIRQPNVYPNPARTGETLNLKSTVPVELYACDGKFLGRFENNLNTAGLSPGIYFLRIASDKSVSLQKMVILNQ